MSPFCRQAWDDTAALRRAIHALPFNRELAQGSLGAGRFRFYIQQDTIYLGQFARVLAIAGARSPDAETLQRFGQFALGAIGVEQALHARYLREFGIDPADALCAEPAPDCLAYTNFLLATAYHEPWEVLIAALLPCFRIYRDVGLAIAQTADGGNPYRAWIDTYADPAFGEAVHSLMAIVDRAATPLQISRKMREAMLDAHRRATQYEYLFWDGAFNLRSWPTPAREA